MPPGKETSTKNVKEIELSWWERMHLMGPDFWAKQQLDYTDTNVEDNVDTDEEGSSNPLLLYVRAAEKAQQLDCDFSALTVEPMADGMVLILNHGEKNVRYVLRF